MPRPRSGFDAQAPPLSYTPFSGSGSRPTNHHDQVASLCTTTRTTARTNLALWPARFPSSTAATRLREHPVPFAPRFPHLGLLTPARTRSHAPKRAQSPAIRADADGSPALRPSPDGRYIARPLTDPSVRRRSDAPRGAVVDGWELEKIRARPRSAFGCRVLLVSSIPASWRACLSGSAALLHLQVRPVTVPEALRLALRVLFCSAPVDGTRVGGTQIDGESK
ncbi:hypothetical protein V8D89_006446 [Ganoderma adspersum]